jgi:hypothetical protein
MQSLDALGRDCSRGAPTLAPGGGDEDDIAASCETSDHLSGELFKMMAAVDMIHVPYCGIAPALTDLLAGQVLPRIDSAVH